MRCPALDKWDGIKQLKAALWALVSVRVCVCVCVCRFIVYKITVSNELGIT